MSEDDGGAPLPPVFDRAMVGGEQLLYVANVDEADVHGDTPVALENARAVRRALEQAGLLRAPAVGAAR